MKRWLALLISVFCACGGLSAAHAMSEEEAAALGKRQIPGSISCVPGAAGLILAGEVIKDLAKVQNAEC